MWVQVREQQTGLEPKRGREGKCWEDTGKAVGSVYYEKEGRMERRGKVWLHRRGWQCGMGKVGGRRLLVTKARGDKVRAEGAGCELLGWCKRRKGELESTGLMRTEKKEAHSKVQVRNQ